MIPVTLSMQGIYSYQNKQVIDFTRLTSAGIFGIFGPVGSGKSTILEAISFALYGRTDRLNLSGDNRNYNMMNLKSNEMLIEFVFKTGAEQTEYMAIVKSRRNSKQFDDVKACDHSAYKKEEGKWVPIEVKSLETVIGLSYDNFKRTIIIPQGKFQEFLMLGGKERSQMMKELFNLEKYELYYKVAALESKSNEQKQNITGNLQQLGDISQEQILAAENILNLTIKEIESKVTELNVKQAEETHQRRIKELVENVAGYDTQLASLKQQEPEIVKLEVNLASYEYCVIHFKGLLDTFESTNGNIQKIKSSINTDESSCKEITTQLKEFETEFESIKKAYETREILKQKADELTKIVRIFDLLDRYRNFLDRISKGEILISETVEKIENSRIQYDKYCVVIKELKEQQPDRNRLAKAKEWFVHQQMLAIAEKDIIGEKTLLSADIDDLIQQKAFLFNIDCFNGISISESYDSIIKILEDKKTVHKNAIEVLTIEKQHYHVQQKLGEYASELKDGNPCPLCGSLEHPTKFNSQNIFENLFNIENEVAHHGKSITLIEAALKKLTEINTILCLKEESIGKLIQKQKEVRQKLDLHKELFIWKEFKTEDDLNLMFEKSEKIQAEISKTENELESLRLQLEKENNQKELYTKTIIDIKNNSIKELATANTLKEQLTILDLNDFKDNNPEILLEQKELLLKQYKVIEERFHDSVSRINKLQKDQDTLYGKLEVNRKTLENEFLSFQTISKNIDEQLKVSSYNTAEEVKTVLSWNISLEDGRKRVATFRQDYDFVEKQLTILNNQLNGFQFNIENYYALVKTIETLSLEINLKNQEKGKLEANLKDMKLDFEKRQKLLEEMVKIDTRLENLKTMKQLFKGAGFVKYISSVYLQELIKAANDRFYKLTGQKLSLEITSENDFEIRDFMNGGKLRNVKTLSGGQTFQAALSLALALSDNTKKLSGADENFFFLDEGFGSLDKKSLEIVFDTLKALRHENRIVGIISHVEEMNQEIEIHLQVKNNEETGSTIEKSWEIN